MRGACALRLRALRSERMRDWSPLGRDTWELGAPGLCATAWYTGARPAGSTGIEGQVLRSSLHMAELHARCLVSRLLPQMGM